MCGAYLPSYLMYLEVSSRIYQSRRIAAGCDKSGVNIECLLGQTVAGSDISRLDYYLPNMRINILNNRAPRKK